MGALAKSKGYPTAACHHCPPGALDCQHSRRDVAEAASPTTSCPLMVVWGTEVVCVYKGSQDQSPVLLVNIR